MLLRFIRIRLRCSAVSKLSLKNYFCVFSVLLFPNLLFAQTIALEGCITDHREPLCFVSVSVKNASVGTISNSDGKFRLVVPQRYLNDVICFSLMGYKTREVKIKGWVKDIQLEKADFMLPEVSIIFILPVRLSASSGNMPGIEAKKITEGLNQKITSKKHLNSSRILSLPIS